MKFSSILFLLFVTFNAFICEESNYYKLLGVGRDATVQEIRKAFKVLAVKWHPDKNKEDKDANKKFIKLARAYEVLKDPESRKQYDLYGDQTDASKFKKQYHSYDYYRNQFGIYDDDPLIITLSKNDYEVNILDNNQAWFVNFYSPNCHHCHELAPTWRMLSRELEGVIRIAAVNCEDDFYLCHQLQIEAYPTLLYYEKKSNLYEGVKYRGDRTVEALQTFVLSKIKVDIKKISSINWETVNQQEWLLFLCGGNAANCPQKDTMIKLTASLEGLMSIAIVEEVDLCKKLHENYQNNPVILWQVKNEVDKSIFAIHSIKGSDSMEILENILNFLPNPELLNEKKFQHIRSLLRKETDKPWLICFFLGQATDLNLQLKRLPLLIPNINIGLIHCGKNTILCSTLHVPRYPSWGILKVGGAFELHHGRDILHEIVVFARESIKSTNLHALSPADLHNIKSEGTVWFIDWYAPWCPPCRKLLPELRKASQHFEPEQVQFGTIDCTLHSNLCTKEGITSYPTTILYNGTITNKFHGDPNEDGIVEFVRDILNPIVITLDENSYIQLMRKPKNEMWLVDFYAPWCGPCQKLGPHWRRLGNFLKDTPDIKVAHVDCVANSDLCDAQNIRSYPTIRLYPLGSKGLNSVIVYNGNRDAESLKRWVLNFLPSPVIVLKPKDFRNQILKSQYNVPWLVDFYAPWCSHCTDFEPVLNIVSKELEGYVKTAKMDCEENRIFCGELGITGYPSLRLYLSSSDFYRIDIHQASVIVSHVKDVIEQNKYKQRHIEL